MSLRDTVVERTRKLLRVQFEINVAGVTAKTKLGTDGIGFDDIFINGEFRARTNRWFEDMSDAIPPDSWDEDTSVGGVADDVVDASDLASPAGYRAHATARVNEVLDANGIPQTGVPQDQRQAVMDDLNTRLLTLLLRDVSLDKLEGSRADVVENVVRRMVIQ
jgi:hypothetical protein